jgi:hypothetical protein
MRTHKTSRIIAGIAVIGAVAAGGAVFTATSSVPNTVAGYATSAISGANATSLDYTLSADGATIELATMIFTEDLTGNTVRAGFGTNALTACTVEPADTAGHTVTCVLSQATATADAFHVAVSG